MTLRSICLHGPESTGKSTMAPRLARHFDTRCIAEFGRTYCEAFGTDLSMADNANGTGEGLDHGQDIDDYLDRTDR